jgi:hypothetical protein
VIAFSPQSRKRIGLRLPACAASMICSATMSVPRIDGIGQTQDATCILKSSNHQPDFIRLKRGVLGEPSNSIVFPLPGTRRRMAPSLELSGKP